ncbi:hypothetical protein Sango_2770200 [Sesamum angolense]|uniref:Uncharacterized protein n=1 Tax=Sesamum angolense TaxID=2727404 RepID=A0AAE1T8B8_9LAMI|nr:hypothetical protein Sango_2770200 [Sesamum angolense]
MKTLHITAFYNFVLRSSTPACKLSLDFALSYHAKEGILCQKALFSFVRKINGRICCGDPIVFGMFLGRCITTHVTATIQWRTGIALSLQVSQFKMDNELFILRKVGELSALAAVYVVKLLVAAASTSKSEQTMQGIWYLTNTVDNPSVLESYMTVRFSILPKLELYYWYFKPEIRIEGLNPFLSTLLLLLKKLTQSFDVQSFCFCIVNKLWGSSTMRFYSSLVQLLLGCT